jgi:hypothetical protein
VNPGTLVPLVPVRRGRLSVLSFACWVEPGYLLIAGIWVVAMLSTVFSVP